MYEHETLQDELDRRDGIPDYYDTMYLDGYDVNQICRAFVRINLDLLEVGFAYLL